MCSANSYLQLTFVSVWVSSALVGHLFEYVYLITTSQKVNIKCNCDLTKTKTTLCKQGREHEHESRGKNGLEKINKPSNNNTSSAFFNQPDDDDVGSAERSGRGPGRLTDKEKARSINIIYNAYV